MKADLRPDEIPAWRKQMRATLIERRVAIPADALEDLRRRIDLHIQRAFPDLVHAVVGFCWPYRNEYDARHLLALMRRAGAVTVLPVVLGPKMPLEFREWHPGVPLQSGVLGIPFPASGTARQPDTLLIPVVGFDARGYRLGYGGGYFDLTLAAMTSKPRAIAVSYEQAFIDTIHPQPHDLPMDYVVTERGVYRREGEVLRFLDDPRAFSSPPCYAGEIGPGYLGATPDPAPRGR